MFETGDTGAPSATGGARALTLVLLAADAAVWGMAATMLAGYGL